MEHEERTGKSQKVEEEWEEKRRGKKNVFGSCKVRMAEGSKNPRFVWHIQSEVILLLSGLHFTSFLEQVVCHKPECTADRSVSSWRHLIEVSL